MLLLSINMSYEFLQHKVINYIIDYLNSDHTNPQITKITYNDKNIHVTMINKKNKKIKYKTDHNFLENLSSYFVFYSNEKYNFEYMMIQLFKPIMNIYGFTIMNKYNNYDRKMYNVIVPIYEIENQSTYIKVSIRKIYGVLNQFRVIIFGNYWDMCSSFYFLVDPVQNLKNILKKYKQIKSYYYTAVNYLESKLTQKLFTDNINSKIYDILIKYLLIKNISYNDNHIMDINNMIIIYYVIKL